MVKLQYNLDEIQDFNLEAGLYRAKLIKVEQTLSSKKKPMLIWYWKIVSGAEKGKEIRSYTSLVETALGNLKNHLMAFHLKGKVSTNTGKLIGKYAILVVAVTPSNQPGREGTMFSNVAAVNPDRGAGANLDEDEDEDEETEDEVDEDEDLDEEGEEDEEDEEEAPSIRKSSKKVIAKKIVAKPVKSKRRVVEDDDEDESENEDEEPVRSVKTRKIVRKTSSGRLPF